MIYSPVCNPTVARTTEVWKPEFDETVLIPFSEQRQVGLDEISAERAFRLLYSTSGVIRTPVEGSIGLRSMVSMMRLL